MKKLPSSLIVAIWLTGGAWMIAVGHYYWDLPPAVLWGAALMIAVAATVEWLTGGEPPQ